MLQRSLVGRFYKSELALLLWQHLEQVQSSGVICHHLSRHVLQHLPRECSLHFRAHSISPASSPCSNHLSTEYCHGKFFGSGSVGGDHRWSFQLSPVRWDRSGTSAGNHSHLHPHPDAQFIMQHLRGLVEDVCGEATAYSLLTSRRGIVLPFSIDDPAADHRRYFCVAVLYCDYQAVSEEYLKGMDEHQSVTSPHQQSAPASSVSGLAAVGGLLSSLAISAAKSAQALRSSKFTALPTTELIKNVFSLSNTLPAVAAIFPPPTPASAAHEVLIPAQCTDQMVMRDNTNTMEATSVIDPVAFDGLSSFVGVQGNGQQARLSQMNCSFIAEDEEFHTCVDQSVDLLSGTTSTPPPHAEVVGCVLASTVADFPALRRQALYHLHPREGAHLYQHHHGEVPKPSTPPDWAMLLEILSPADIQTLCAAFLLEAKILVVVSQTMDLRYALHLSSFLHAACSPLVWRHVHAPVVCELTALQLLGCPAPFFLGTTSAIYHRFCQVNDGVPSIESGIVVEFLSVDKVNVLISPDTVLENCLRCDSSRYPGVDWLKRRLSVAMRPMLSAAWEDCSFASSESSSPHGAQCAAEFVGKYVDRFPVEMLALPTLHFKHSAPKWDQVSTLCRHYVSSLLCGLEECCISTLLPSCSSAMTLQSVECSPSLESSTDRQEEFEDEGCGMAAEADVATQLYSEPGVIFDEEMFIDLKNAQVACHVAWGGESISWAEGFLRTFLRSQCLADHLREFPVGDKTQSMI